MGRLATEPPEDSTETSLGVMVRSKIHRTEKERQTHHGRVVSPAAAEISHGCPRHLVRVGGHRRDGISAGVDEQVRQNHEGDHQERPREVLE